MNKNDIIAFVLIALLLVGSSLYPVFRKKAQDKKALKAATEYVAENASVMQTADSTAVMELEEVTEPQEQNSGVQEQNSSVEEVETSSADEVSTAVFYKDASLNEARSKAPSLCRLENDKLEVVFNTKGAQPYTVRVKGYTPYKSRKDTTVTPDSTSLRLVQPGMSYVGISVYAGEMVNTGDLVFDIAETTDTTVSMRVYFANGGYIQQKYTLSPDSYVLKDDMSFVGLQDVIPSKVSNVNFDWAMIVPRLEKGYKNEKQYSNLSYYYDGEKKVEQLTPRRNNFSNKTIPAKVRWIDFKQQFFSSIITAPNDFLSGEVTVKFSEEKEYLEKNHLMTCTARMVSEIKHSDDIHLPYEFYFGPNDYQGLRKLGNKYEKVIPLGGNVVGLISRFIIIPTFRFLHKFIGSYGIIILIMTLLLKAVLSPFTIKSYRSSAVTQVLKPEIDKLNEKYPKQEDAMKKQQAQMELYKKAGVSPMGGCLPMLLQMPILWAMFRFFPASIELRQQHFLWAEDLSAYDSVLNIGGWHLSLFALLMAVTMFFYSKMNSKTMSDDPNMAPMKFMSVWMMPIMMFFICNGLSSALSYYYLLSNIFTMLQTWVIKKWFVDEDKILAKVRARAAAPVKKSKWQQRLEQIQKMQAQQMKNSKK